MPKAIKRRTCRRCEVEKLVVGNFTGAAATCKACAKGSDRVCGGCDLLKPASAFSDGAKRSCRDCNKQKDTADHVEACCTPGCEVAFSRNPDTFTWRSRSSGGNWNSTCKRCCAPTPKEEVGHCSRCGELKQLVHGLQCSDCVNERHKRAREEACVTADPSNTPGKACTRDGCGRPFSPEEFRWQGDRWSSWCKECYNGARYHAACRARRLAENPEDFREHNNAVLRSWRERNPDKVVQYQQRQKSDQGALWLRWVRQAKIRGIDIAMHEEADLRDLFLQECHYCGYLPSPEDPLNTLDRVDNNTRLYSLHTCVSCCVPCNWLKGSACKEQFLEEAREFASSRSVDDLPADRRAIDAAFRCMGIRGEVKEPAPREQLLYVAMHHGHLS